MEEFSVANNLFFFFCMSRLYSQGARFLCNNGQLEKSSKLCGQQHKNVRYEM